MSETFSSAAALQKAQREVQAFHRLGKLSHQLLEVNEIICRTRLVEESPSTHEETRK